jgi:ribosomal protein S18 acetylase RimI-like enzyme
MFMLMPSSFAVSLPVEIRLCTADDLSHLEWFGVFAQDREIIRAAFAMQTRGEGAILVAVINGFPAGQVWIDFVRHAAASAGYLWAMRVFPWLQGLGLGRALLQPAESLLRACGCAWVELSVDFENTAAQRFYRACGYEAAGGIMEEKERLRFRKALAVARMREPIGGRAA